MKLFKKHQITEDKRTCSVCGEVIKPEQDYFDYEYWGKEESVHHACSFADIEEQVKQTDAVKVQEYHKSAERIAQMIKDADEREMW